MKAWKYLYIIPRWDLLFESLFYDGRQTECGSDKGIVDRVRFPNDAVRFRVTFGENTKVAGGRWQSVAGARVGG